MSDNTPESPIAPEQWLSYVIALQSQRSSNPGQREFGNRIMELVFDKLPARFHDDAVARSYFDNVLAEVAWAVRGFSVVRDIYQTNIGSLEQSKQTEMKRIESLQKLSPLASDTLWGRVKGGLLGIGLASPLFALAAKWFGTAAPAMIISGAVVVVVGLVLAEVFISLYVAHRLKSLHSSMPGATLQVWKEKALTGYKAVSRGFLEKVAAIEQRYYPQNGSGTLSEGGQAAPESIDSIIERAFSLDS